MPLVNDDRWQRIKDCVADALERPARERESWLREVCQDDETLFVEACSLVRAAELADGFLSVGYSYHSATPATDIADELPERQLRTIGHYRLGAWLGAGGMGEVFLARDVALGRDAALKLLPRRFAPELRFRLMREAEAIAKVQHPAIATFYETGEEDGEAFIAMEYVQGQTLRGRLADGALPVAESFAIARCVLEALQHAHAAGILHRDIKPENVMVTTSRAAKLLDFGLAKHLLAAPRPEDATVCAPAVLGRVTRLAGTIGYMAPEQLRGEPLDERTDVFQVGTLVYEMLSGHPAFVGESPLERLAAVMMRDADFDALPWSDLPPGSDAMLRRALARDPSQRYPTAAAFLRDLEDLTEGRLTTELAKVLAVLDFENVQGEPDAAWMGSAVAEGVRTGLTRLRILTVISRDSARDTLAAMKRDRLAADPVGLGLRLGCGWVLIGNVQSSTISVRITARLIEVATPRVAATETVAGSLDDLCSMQDALVRWVASALGVPDVTVTSSPTKAYVQECLGRARLLLDRLQKGATEQARELLEQAVAVDGRYAPALVALAQAYCFRSISTTDPDDLAHALQLASRAIEIDPTSEAYTWKGYVFVRQNRFEDALLAHRRASELDPTNLDAPYFVACALLFLGRREEALVWFGRYIDADVRSGMAWLGLGVTHLCLQQHAEARYAFTRAQQSEANPSRSPCAGAAAYVAEVMRLERRASAARAYALAGLESAERSDHSYRDTFRAHALVVLGRCALDEHDHVAARAAFQQVLSQARGRPRTRACGHVVVEALAGLARANRDPSTFVDACHLFESRATFNFEPFFGMLDELTLFELAYTAHALGFADEARALLGRAHDAGSRRVLPVHAP